ncbi:MAG: MaoC family dehydratase N-terminal domain-containing protein [Archangium sp.]|nr:MaoC family dehydratase N-terminal domain-containing protein [Archangium sp.]
MPPRKLYFENIRIGDELPAMAKAPIDRVQLARYAGATGDFNPVQVDETAARAAGMPSVVAPTTIGMGFLSQLVGDWARGAQVRKLTCRFSRMLWPGDTLVCKGRVADRHGQDGKYFLELDVWAENQQGQLAIRGNVTLKVFYSVEDENRFRMGQPPLILNVPRESIRVAPPPVEVKVKKGGKAAKPAKGAKKAKPAKAKKAPKPKKAAPKKPSKPAKKKKKK